jgi:hypothetical protein
LLSTQGLYLNSLSTRYTNLNTKFSTILSTAPTTDELGRRHGVNEYRHTLYY